MGVGNAEIVLHTGFVPKTVRVTEICIFVVRPCEAGMSNRYRQLASRHGSFT